MLLRHCKVNEDPLTDGREGLKSLELLIAIYMSARDGKKVSLPLVY
jgi:UDP-N-acetyl-2-amino-2-deoxyglucuronate dehydrogenase